MVYNEIILISIIVPVYNVEAYVEKCLDSLIHQTYKNIEIICVCEPSEDNSIYIVERYKDIDERIKIVYNKEKMGLSYNRNIGMRMSRGTYIYFLDSDDWIEDNAIEQMLKIAQKYKADVVGFGTKEHNESSICAFPKYIGEFKVDTELCDEGPHIYDVLLQKNAYVCEASWQYFFYKSFLEDNELKFLDGVLHEDVLFAIYMFSYAKRLVVINDILHNYRRRDFSITDRRNRNYKYIVKSFIMMYMDLIRNYERRCLSLEQRHIFEIGKRKIEEQIKDNILKLTDQETDYLISWTIDNGSHFYVSSFFLLNSIRCSLSKYKAIYVYGAGSVAKKIIKLCDDANIHIKGLIVTYDTKETDCFGYRIVSLQNFNDKAIDAIIIGVGAKLNAEVREIVENTFEGIPIIEYKDFHI